ncbi:MAG: response regulator [Desulfobacteraceae bacterium]|nr:response regulator [Desulfobacteraceae bacterium]
MDRVLIVDDEKSLLLSLEAGLTDYHDRFTLFTAENGKDALEILESKRIDLVVTDLRMPVMDGFELLAKLASDFPSIPAMVMTAYATPESQRKIQDLNNIRIIEKPVDFDELTQAILENLEIINRGGSITGISLPNFMDLIEKEEKTCLLEILKNTKSIGLLFFNKGQIWDAVCGKTNGEAAVFNLLAKEDVQISFRNLPKKKIKRRINANLISLLLESARRIDEENDTETQEAISDQKDAKNNEVNTGGDEDPGEAEPVVPLSTKGEEKMSQIEEVLEKFRDVEGFQAVGVFSPQGEMVSQVNASGLEIAELGALANDVLLKAQKATEIMGVGRGQLVHVEAPKAHLIARCLNEATDFAANSEGRAHIHMVLAISKEGNLAMGKMKLASIIQELAQYFR